ncbi:hypothetical protein ABMA75_03450 [Halobacteriovorax sp. ZH4_bin.1]|uniref:hypothetical protein n=1 Tax=unclassified Halobacteriovorax TaxID=2639665 RepID=UPI00371857F4
MKYFIKSLLVLTLISNVFASDSCHNYLVMPELDGRVDITEKVLKVFEDKGYTFTEVKSIDDLPTNGTVNYMTIFSDLHKYRGAYTSISMHESFLRDGEAEYSQKSSIRLTKKPLFGSWVKSLIRSVKKKVPDCE